MMKVTRVIYFLVLVIITSMLLHVSVALALTEKRDILYLDFSDENELLKHIDNETEKYDSGRDGSSREYIDPVNHWFVFEGDNSNTSNGYDQPIAVVKSYCGINGFDSYAVLPYNYTVKVDVYFPSDPGHGSFYILPRYKKVTNSYGVGINSDSDSIVFYKVTGGNWHSIKSIGTGFDISTGVWYSVELNITWNGSMNHINISILDRNNPANKYSDHIEDSDLPPSQYNGLGFLGFSYNSRFKVYIDNLEIYTIMEKIGEEPSEGYGDLDVSSLYVYNDEDNMIILMQLENNISLGSTEKYWVVQFDTDRDSRLTKNGWDYEYSIIASLDSGGIASSNLYDSSGNWITSQQIIGGGIEYSYLLLLINTSLIGSIDNGIYMHGYTQEGGNMKDEFPGNPDKTGNYYIYYLQKPEPSSPWSIKSDDTGEVAIPKLDITEIGSARSTDILFLRVNVTGTLEWYGGSSSGIYRVYVDADNNPSTGYDKESVGADYLVEYVVGFSPALWEYNGDGSDWSWSFIERVDYTYNPGGDKVITYIVPISVFNDPPLSQTFSILGETGQNSNIVDDTSPLPIPIPEPWIIPMIMFLVAMTFIVFKARKSS